MPRYPLLAVLVAAVALPTALAPAGTAATPATLAPVTNDTPLSAYGGWVLWSEMRADGRWALTGWHDGVKTRLPVRTRATPFDVDVGPDGSGQAVALYSRCARDPVDPTAGVPRTGFIYPGGVPSWSIGSACRIHRLDLATGRERALHIPGATGGSDATPSLWRNRIAFGRRPRGGDLTRIMLWTPQRRRLRRLRGGDLPRTCPYRAGCKRETFDGDALQLDLGPHALAALWEVQAPAVYGVGVGWEVLIDRLADGSQELASFGIGSGMCGRQLPGSPNAVGTGVWFAENTYDCEVVRTYAAYGDGKVHGHVESAPDLLWQLARDGNQLYTIRGPSNQDQPDGDPPCIGAAGPCRLTVEPLPRSELKLLPGSGASPQFDAG